MLAESEHTAAQIPVRTMIPIPTNPHSVGKVPTNTNCIKMARTTFLSLTIRYSRLQNRMQNLRESLPGSSREEQSCLLFPFEERE